RNRCAARAPHSGRIAPALRRELPPAARARLHRAAAAGFLEISRRKDGTQRNGNNHRPRCRAQSTSARGTSRWARTTQALTRLQVEPGKGLEAACGSTARAPLCRSHTDRECTTTANGGSCFCRRLLI